MKTTLTGSSPVALSTVISKVVYHTPFSSLYSGLAISSQSGEAVFVSAADFSTRTLPVAAIVVLNTLHSSTVNAVFESLIATGILPVVASNPVAASNTGASLSGFTTIPPPDVQSTTSKVPNILLWVTSVIRSL